MTDFSGKVALVTGASRGLGYAVAKALALRGAHVIALARTVGGLEELDDEIQAAGGAATLVPLDLTDDAGLERLGAAIHDRWGKLDLWINCAAAAAPMAPAEHAAASDFDKALAVNARGVQRMIRVLQPLLKAGDGEAAHIDDPDAGGAKFFSAYGASKAAGAAIVASWAAEASRIGPRVWRAAPPPMPTAVRARFHPGEDPSRLAPCAEVAERLIASLGVAAPGALVRI